MYSGRLYDQVLKLHYLGFIVLPAVALTLQFHKQCIKFCKLI